jgi:hypothetical protein
MIRLAWWAVWLPLVTAPIGCRSQSAPEPSEPTPPRPDPLAEPHIADAMAELEQAERRIDQIIAPGTARSMEPPSDEDEARSCETACRALDAMERAAAHLCELAGDRDARCGAARDRVRSAGTRIRQTCGGCHSA